MTDAKMTDERLVLHGSFTSSSTYKPMLFLALSGLPFSFRTVNLKNGVQKLPEHLAINRYGQVPVLRHRGLTLVMSMSSSTTWRAPRADSRPRPSRIAGGRGNGCRGKTTPSRTSPGSAISAASARSIPRS